MLQPFSAPQHAFLALALAWGPPAAAPCAQASLALTDPPASAFEPGLRWSANAAEPTAWIPGDVALAAHGELVWSASSGQTRFQLHAAGALGSGELRRAHTPVGTSIVGAHVAGGADGGALFASYQLDAGAGLRRLRVSRHEPAQSASDPAADMAGVWTYEVGPAALGTHEIHGDDESLVVAVHRTADAVVQVDWIDPEDGALLVRAELPGDSLRGIAASHGAARVALSVADQILVLQRSGTQVALVHAATLTTPAQALALSGNGQWLAHGNGNALVLNGFGSAGFTPFAVHRGTNSEIPLVVELADSAGRGAVGWWDAQSGRTARVELFEAGAVGTLLVLAQHAQSNPKQGLQELPADLALTSDGQRVAAAFWGGSTSDEVILLDRDQGLLLSVDLPGSAFAVDLDAAGTRIAVAGKQTHANVLSGLGSVHLIQTGERDLELLGSPDLGGSLVLAARREGRTATAFLVGPPLEQSQRWAPGIAGELWIDPAQPWWILVGSAQVSDPDVAVVEAGIPLLPALAGLPLACQAVSAATASPVALSANVARPALF